MIVTRGFGAKSLLITRGMGAYAGVKKAELPFGYYVPGQRERRRALILKEDREILTIIIDSVISGVIQ